MLPRKFYLDDLFNNYEKNKYYMECDIYEKDDKYYVEVDVPGFKKEEIKIHARNGYLTISAEKSNEEVDNNKNYLKKERIYNKYQRTIYLGDFDETDCDASYKDGTLTIIISKNNNNENNNYIEIK